MANLVEVGGRCQRSGVRVLAAADADGDHGITGGKGIDFSSSGDDRHGEIRSWKDLCSISHFPGMQRL